MGIVVSIIRQLFFPACQAWKDYQVGRMMRQNAKNSKNDRKKPEQLECKGNETNDKKEPEQFKIQREQNPASADQAFVPRRMEIRQDGRVSLAPPADRSRGEQLARNVDTGSERHASHGLGDSAGAQGERTWY